MAITVLFILQCDYCEKTDETQQTLTFLPMSATAPILLDVSDDEAWEVLDDALYCAGCADTLKHPVCDA